MSDQTAVPAVREEKVKQAVQFLADSRVSAAPLERAVGFLQRKGLTSGEIREALKRSAKEITPEAEKALQNPETPAPAATAAVTAAPGAPAPVAAAQPQVVYYTPAPAQSASAVQAPRVLWKETVLWAGAVSGLVLAVRELLRKFVLPIYFPEESEGKRIKDMQSEVRELGKAVKSLQENLKSADNREHLAELTAVMKDCTKQMREITQQSKSIEGIREKIDLLMATAETRGTPTTSKTATTVTNQGIAPSAAHRPPPPPLYAEAAVEEDFFNLEPSRERTRPSGRPSETVRGPMPFSEARESAVESHFAKVSAGAGGNSEASGAATGPADTNGQPYLPPSSGVRETANGASGRIPRDRADDDRKEGDADTTHAHSTSKDADEIQPVGS